MASLHEIDQAFRKIGEQESRKLGVVAAANKTYSLKEVQEMLTDMLTVKSRKPVEPEAPKKKAGRTLDQLNEELFG